MPRRRIGQERFCFSERQANGSLDKLHGLVDWEPVDEKLRQTDTSIPPYS